MGVRYDEQQDNFVFDFEHDGRNDIIQLTGDGYDVTAFSHCFYYGYEFSDDISGSVRSAFIKHVKFTENLKENPDLTHFIQKAIDDLNKKIDLYDYDLVVMPESSSKINQYMLRYIYRFAQPMLPLPEPSESPSGPFPYHAERNSEWWQEASPSAQRMTAHHLLPDSALPFYSRYIRL